MSTFSFPGALLDERVRGLSDKAHRIFVHALDSADGAGCVKVSREILTIWANTKTDSHIYNFIYEIERAGLWTIARGKPNTYTILVDPRPAAHRAVIDQYIADYSLMFHDNAVPSNKSQAWNIYGEARVSLEQFIAAMQRAREITQEAQPRIKDTVKGKDGKTYKKAMHYWFKVLRGELGLPVKPSKKPKQSAPPPDSGMYHATVAQALTERQEREQKQQEQEQEATASPIF